MNDLHDAWTVFFHDNLHEDDWLIEEGLSDVTAALALRERWLSKHPDSAQIGTVVITAPAVPWPHCSGCHQPQRIIAGIPVCVSDTCPRGVGPYERAGMRRAINALRSVACRDQAATSPDVPRTGQ